MIVPRDRVDHRPRGLSVLIRDIIAWLESKICAPIALGQLWHQLDRPSLNLGQTVIQRYVSAVLTRQRDSARRCLSPARPPATRANSSGRWRAVRSKPPLSPGPRARKWPMTGRAGAAGTRGARAFVRPGLSHSQGPRGTAVRAAASPRTRLPGSLCGPCRLNELASAEGCTSAAARIEVAPDSSAIYADATGCSAAVRAIGPRIALVCSAGAIVATKALPRANCSCI